jgi:hypothetical protein
MNLLRVFGLGGGREGGRGKKRRIAHVVGYGLKACPAKMQWLKDGLGGPSVLVKRELVAAAQTGDVERLQVALAASPPGRKRKARLLRLWRLLLLASSKQPSSNSVSSHV